MDILSRVHDAVDPAKAAARVLRVVSIAAELVRVLRQAQI